MKKGYSPSEHMEAQDKKEHHKEGRKEAEFYRQLLNGLYRDIMSQAKRAGDATINPQFKGETIDLDTTTHKLKEFKFCDQSDMQETINRLSKSISQAVGINNIRVRFETKSLTEMPPSQFRQHIEDQKASLIKD